MGNADPVLGLGAPARLLDDDDPVVVIIIGEKGKRRALLLVDGDDLGVEQPLVERDHRIVVLVGIDMQVVHPVAVTAST